VIIEIALGILLAVFLLATIRFWLPIVVGLAGLAVLLVVLGIAALIVLNVVNA
jgi:hypothetical protein